MRAPASQGITPSIVGRFMKLGPGGVSAEPVVGVVTATHIESGHETSVTTKPDGNFTIGVRPGFYAITGRSEAYLVDGKPGRCVGSELIAVDARNTPVDIVCPEAPQ